MKSMPYEEAPRYSGRIQVSQSSEDISASVGIGASILAAAPFFAAVFWCMDNEFTVAFLTLRARDGARIDLVLEARPEHNALLDALDERGRLIG